jgi:DNA-binding NtrC family response regulator
VVDPSSRPRGHQHTDTRPVLIVEDDDAVREFVRQVLTAAGHSVVTACDGEDGLQKYRLDPDRFKVVLTDVVMPGRTGPELVEQIRRIRPGTPVLFMSAYTGGTATHPVELPAGVPVVQKPFEIDRLLRAVAGAGESSSRG